MIENTDPKESSSTSSTRRRRRLYETEEFNSEVSSDNSNPSTPSDVSSSEQVQSNGSTSDDIQIQAADNTIKYYCYWSFSAALIPIPVVDLAAMTTIQVKLVQELSELYDVPFSHGKAKKAVTILVAGMSSATFASLGKLVPGLGYFGLVAPLAIINVSHTYAVGKIFAQHFQAGDNLDSFDAVDQKETFKSKIKDGKEFARRTKEEFKSKFKREQKAV